MSESERYIGFRRRKMSLGADGNSLMALISINAVILLLLGLTRVIYLITQSPVGAFEGEVMPWFNLSANVSKLASRPWTVLSYMFTQLDVIIALTNMLWLWVFGSIFQDMTGNKKIIPLYIYGGLAGAVLFIASYYALPPLKASINEVSFEGASTAIMAIAVATTTIAPDFRFFKMINGGIPLWIITVLYIIIDFAGIAGRGPAFTIAHLGGGLVGFLFVIGLRKGSDWSLWMNVLYSKFINLFNPDKKTQQVKRTKEKVFYKTGNNKPFVKKSHITQQRIDEILDKINLKGYQSLTEDEKGILKRAAEVDL